MRISIIRHGMTEANEKRLYCGFTDAELSAKGKLGLTLLKESFSYPTADIYITSGMARTTDTLRLLCNREPDFIITEFKEINFGHFEMKSYDELKHNPEYQDWITGDDSTACPGGESRNAFKARVTEGLRKLSALNTDSAIVICHGGVIATIMEALFPGEKNFYEWQPDFGRGYTLDISGQNALLISEI